MARFGQRKSFSASLSPVEAAAKPCAKFVQESRARVGPPADSAFRRPRYNERSERLRSRIRSVTASKRGFSGIDDVDMAALRCVKKFRLISWRQAPIVCQPNAIR